MLKLREAVCKVGRSTVWVVAGRKGGVFFCVGATARRWTGKGKGSVDTIYKRSGEAPGRRREEKG